LLKKNEAAAWQRRRSATLVNDQNGRNAGRFEFPDKSAGLLGPVKQHDCRVHSLPQAINPAAKGCWRDSQDSHATGCSGFGELGAILAISGDNKDAFDSPRHVLPRR
jgi:hypothetical protein